MYESETDLIHSERIFAAGADAGGILALNLAYCQLHGDAAQERRL